MPFIPQISPIVVVFLGLGTAYALVFHLWRGRNLQHLLLFWLVSVLGFALGSTLGGISPFHPVLLGGIPVMEASLGSMALLLLARRFTL